MLPIYQRIEDLCEKKGINVTVLCKECGIPRASLSDYKNGRKKSLSTDTLSKIAEYFDVSVDYLYGGEAPVPNESAIKVALFGGDMEVTDEMWDEVRRYARYIAERNNENNNPV